MSQTELAYSLKACNPCIDICRPPEGWKAELAWLVDPLTDILPTKWIHVNHR